ncbi:efflux RND transporter periplasmic adaptor subunit [uncultured Desulfovibrio sp.]|uniref:Efflux RND transporter periplasmic adaptor subunit n=1 Tax=Candidatus Desulfovibrio intestinavium TaxID=2838534 RepID=A0A9D2HN42_9BACT|nr:efflux RND transporter periplasmic adaptor subunit [uncultured Desulfovibrio sp.]HJA78528.1 efflux RND transporter periplasmic adaptor subunit [Candidatus Desulfovibrio intestinavium]
MRFAVTFLLTVLLAALAVRSGYAAEIRLTGKVVTTVTRAALMPFNAVVDEVLVQPGDAVEEGAPLMRYHLQDEAARMLQREVVTGAGTEGERSQILSLRQELTDIEAQRNKARQLAASGLGSRQASSRLDANYDSIQRRIELLKLTIAKQEKNFAARMRELEGYFGQKLDPQGELPQTLTLTSPIAGYVLSVSAGTNPGSLLQAGAAPVSVGQLNPVIIRVPVYEADVNRIAVNDVATVQIPSLQDKEFMATVSEISWASTDMNVGNPSYYTVELTVPNPALELKPGFQAIVRFNK